MKRIKEIWKNRKLIFEGIWNTIFRKRYIEKVAAERMAICLKCDEIDYEGDSCAWKGTQPCCSLCGCSLELKTRSLASECPSGYWEALEPLDDEDEDDNNQYFDNQNN